MALQLFKLVIDASTTTDTDLNPDIQRFFYEVNEDDIDAGVLTIPSTSFVDDAGDPVVGDLPLITPENGYYLLFVNGVLQQEGLYTVAANQVTVNDATTILPDTPVVLVVNEFAPTSVSDTNVAT